jgi:hypothetical protein
MNIEEFLLNLLKNYGYTHLKIIDNQVFGIIQFIYTTGLTVGIATTGYKTKFCYSYKTRSYRSS